MGQVPPKYFLPSSPYGSSPAANVLNPSQPAAVNPQVPLLPPNFQDPGTMPPTPALPTANPGGGGNNPFSGGPNMGRSPINQMFGRGLFGALLLSLLASFGSATTTVTGNIKDLGTTNVTNGMFVRFWLRGCQGAQPRVNGTTVIAPTQGAVYYKDFVADANGNISGTVYSTRDITGNGNGEIECPSSVFTATWYGVQLFLGGRGGPEVPVAAKNGATLNVTNATPLTTNPIVIAPTGDTTYIRLDGGNSPVTGAIQFTGGGSIQGTWTAGPTYSISTVSETGNIVTVTTSTTCPAITGANLSIFISGVGVAGYNSGPGGINGFFTTAACSGSTFTYFNPISGLASSSGGTVVLSPIFTQGLTHAGPETVTGNLTYTNHNQIFWAGPGPTPTIDNAVANCPATVTCVVDISPQYTGPESANIFTTSLGYKVYNGANNVTIIDHRQVDSGSGNPTGTNLYGIMYGGRNAGALNRIACNYYAHNPTDSSTCSNSFNWIDGTFSQNTGAMYGGISFSTTHDTVTIGANGGVLAAHDGESYHNATTVDRDLPYITGFTGQTGMSRAGAVGNITTASAYLANNCANVSSTGKIGNCYGFDAILPTTGFISNYGYHNAGSWLSESVQSFDYTDAGLVINAASEASTTVTITTASTCAFVTGQKVRITGVGGISATVVGYNGIWTVLTPGCNGGSTFTYTNTASGLATLGAGGVVRGIYKGMQWLGNGGLQFNASNAGGFSWNTADGVQVGTAGTGGVLVANNKTLGCTTSGSCTLGSAGHEIQEVILLNCYLGGATGTASPAACGNAVSGKIAIPASAGTTYTVNSGNVTTNSLIFLHQTTDNTGLPSSPTCNATANLPAVEQTTKVVGTSFTMNGLANPATISCFIFLIVN